LLPCGYPPACWNATPRIVSLPVSPTPTLSRSCQAPRNSYGLPFRTPKHASRLPWIQATELVPFRQLHPLRSLAPPASPSVSTRVASSQHVAPLLGFCLSRAFSSNASGSQPTWTARAHACTLARKLWRTVQGTLTPLEPGEAAPIRMHRNGLVDGFRPLEGRPAPPLDGAPSPVILELRAKALHS
jgi:hypothetical protein